MSSPLRCLQGKARDTSAGPVYHLGREKRLILVSHPAILKIPTLVFKFLISYIEEVSQTSCGPIISLDLH